MKKVFIVLILSVVSLSILAQSPEMFSYQAVVRDNSDQLVTNQIVDVRIKILKGSEVGTEVYVETHSPLTNDNGLISFEIGGGNIASGNFSDINWLDGPYFIETAIDPDGEEMYSVFSTTQLLSVPYAIHAKTAEYVDDADADPNNEFQTLLLDGTNLEITDGNSISLASIQDGYEANTDAQDLSISGDDLNISNGTGVSLGQLNYWELSGSNLEYSDGHVNLYGSSNSLNVEGMINADAGIYSDANIVADQSIDAWGAYINTSGYMNANNYTTSSGVTAIYEINPYNAMSEDPNDIQFYATTTGVEVRASTSGSNKDIFIPIDIPRELMGTQQKIGTVTVNYKVDNSADNIDACAIYSLNGGLTTVLVSNLNDYSSTSWSTITLSPNDTFTGSLYLYFRLEYNGSGILRDISIGNISVSLEQN